MVVVTKDKKEVTKEANLKYFEVCYPVLVDEEITFPLPISISKIMKKVAKMSWCRTMTSVLSTNTAGAITHWSSFSQTSSMHKQVHLLA